MAATEAPVLEAGLQTGAPIVGTGSDDWGNISLYVRVCLVCEEI